MQLGPQEPALGGRSGDFFKLQNQLVGIAPVRMALPPACDQIGKSITEYERVTFLQSQAPARVVCKRRIELAVVGILKSDFPGLSFRDCQKCQIRSLLASPEGLAAQAR